MRQHHERAVRSFEDGEILNVIVAAVLPFDGVEHDCFGSAVAVEIAGDDLARLGIFFAVLARGLSRDEFVDGGLVSVLGGSGCSNEDQKQKRNNGEGGFHNFEIFKKVFGERREYNAAEFTWPSDGRGANPLRCTAPHSSPGRRLCT